MYNYTQIDSNQCEFYEIAEVSELSDGVRLFVEVAELSIVVFNIAGQYFAIQDICSHDDGPLGDGDLDRLEIICPRHGARFDVRSGKALALPAIVDIPAYPVRVIDGKIEIGVPVKT